MICVLLRVAFDQEDEDVTPGAGAGSSPALAMHSLLSAVPATRTLLGTSSPIVSPPVSPIGTRVPGTVRTYTCLQLTVRSILFTKRHVSDAEGTPSCHSESVRCTRAQSVGRLSGDYCTERQVHRPRAPATLAQRMCPTRHMARVRGGRSPWWHHHWRIRQHGSQVRTPARPIRCHMAGLVFPCGPRRASLIPHTHTPHTRGGVYLRVISSICEAQ